MLVIIRPILRVNNHQITSFFFFFSLEFIRFIDEITRETRIKDFIKIDRKQFRTGIFYLYLIVLL